MNTSVAIINKQEMVSISRVCDINGLLNIQLYLTSYMQVLCNLQPWSVTDFLNPWKKCLFAKAQLLLQSCYLQATGPEYR